jgi:hypothetical protein
MKRILILCVFVLFAATSVFAHGGRTDKCGGHNDRKHGGYHIHNYSKYCACYPDAPECKKDMKGKTPANDKKAAGKEIEK